MGHVFNYQEALAFEQMCNQPEISWNHRLENSLMLKMLQPMWGESVLEIGCGTGVRLLPFLEMGMRVTALDPSPYMIEIASKKVGNAVDFHRGYAENLPFDDNSFHYACLIKTLEFVNHPQKAIEEACRVAKNRVFIGSINKYSYEGTRYRVNRLIKRNVFNYMKILSIWEIKYMIRSLTADAPISWRTLMHTSPTSSFITKIIQNSRLVQRFPFGAFAGIMVILVPRFRTRPLELTYYRHHEDAFAS